MRRRVFEGAGEFAAELAWALAGVLSKESPESCVGRNTCSQCYKIGNPLLLSIQIQLLGIWFTYPDAGARNFAIVTLVPIVGIEMLNGEEAGDQAESDACSAAACARRTGTIAVNVLPCPGWLVTVSEPSWACTIRREIASPSP